MNQELCLIAPPHLHHSSAPSSWRQIKALTSLLQTRPRSMGSSCHHLWSIFPDIGSLPLLSYRETPLFSDWEPHIDTSYDYTKTWGLPDWVDSALLNWLKNTKLEVTMAKNIKVLFLSSRNMKKINRHAPILCHSVRFPWLFFSRVGFLVLPPVAPLCVISFTCVSVPSSQVFLWLVASA